MALSKDLGLKKKDFKRSKSSKQLDVMEPEGLKMREMSY